MFNLGLVAQAFVDAQQLRHAADYDNSRSWTRIEVINLIDRVDAAFKSWHSTRETDAAQVFLIALLGNPR